MSLPSRVRVRVPASSANLGPGFDCLGLALGLSTTFEVEPCSALLDDCAPAIEISSAWGNDPAIDALPDDQRNLFYQAFTTQLAARNLPVPAVRIRVQVGAPPGRGLGSSAAAVVGGLLAAEALAGHLPTPAERTALLETAVALEHGCHADNVAAALLGGLVVTSHDQQAGWQAIRAPLPARLRAVLFVPDFPMDTVAGRALLPDHYTKADAVKNVGHVSLLLTSLATGTLDALGAAMEDRFHQPYRAQLFPQLPDLLAAARAAGAHGACLSGGGSAILAFATERAQEVQHALEQRAAALRLAGRALVVELDQHGATVEVEAHAGASPPAAKAASPGVPPRSLPSQAKTNAGRDPVREGGLRGPQALSPNRSRQASPGQNDLWLSCPACERRYSIERVDYRCACGQPLDVSLHSAGEERDGPAWRQVFDARLSSMDAQHRSGVWRFRDLLLPIEDIRPITRQEGQTTLYAVGRAQAQGGHGRIGKFAGLDALWLKHEGENPTGSFKDRGMTIGVSMANWLGATAVACASTGNTSASMAAYAAQAGLRAIVLLPEGKVAQGKLSQAIAYGAEMRQIAGDFDRAMADVERMCLEEGIYLLNSLNPFRILGQQSLALELAQQFAWDVPDWIVLPAGNLGNTSALGMGLLRAYQLGLITRLPRIASVQASGANPFYQSYLDGFASFQPIKAHTLATAINIGNPVSYTRARAVIQATNGVVTEVSDEEMLRAKAMIDRAGIGCEPASAASVAGARKLVAEGIISPQARVVAILTGNLLKDPDSIRLAQQVMEPVGAAEVA
jgi:threonine synthase